MALEKTWRWFGPDDLISLENLRQIGVEGVVTSLHHIKKGQVWEVAEIQKMKRAIESREMTWSVVESLPVHEEIKYAGKKRDDLIENYIQSIRNLGECGISTVCYNFMPVIDWIRTDLHYRLPDGSESLYFDLAKFAAFEIFILERPGAREDYPPDIIEKAIQAGETMTDVEKNNLVDNIIVKTQGFIDGIKAEDAQSAVTLFRKLLDLFGDVDKSQLRKNLLYFLNQIIPEAEKAGVRFAIHPDDPPRSVLGLPRIVSTSDDIEWILNEVDSPANGYTFCTGSLSVNAGNNLIDILSRTSDRIQFVHLRNTILEDNGNFYETGHLKGRVDMVEIIKILLMEQEKRKSSGRDDYTLPMRVDHGLRILQDFQYDYNPGYPLLGRMKGFAELCGVERGISQFKNQNSFLH